MKNNSDLFDKQQQASKSIGVCKLIVISYCLICAGSYGIEESVQAGGPLVVIICMLIVSIFMGFPASMIYSELGSLFPQTGSTILWPYNIQKEIQFDYDMNRDKYTEKQYKRLKAKLIFSKIVTRFTANLLLLKAVVDNAVYPTMVCDYLQQIIPGLSHVYYRLLLSFVCYAIIFVFNMFGVDAVGISQYVITALLLTPCIFFVILALPYYDAKYLTWNTRPEQLDFVTVFSNLIWLFSGYDQITNLSENVNKPQKTYPITFISVILLVFLTYFLTIVSGIMVEQDFTKWNNGDLATISLKLYGCSSGWLKWWLTIGGAISAFAILNSSVTCSALELYCNAHIGLLPFPRWVDQLKSFRRHKHIKQPPKQKVENKNNIEEQEEKEENEVKEVPLSIEYDGHLRGDTSAQHSVPEVICDEEEMSRLGLVPWVAVIVVSVFPLMLVILPFNRIVILNAFQIALSMFTQMIFYIYHRHGKYGYYKCYTVPENVFHLKGGPWATAAIVFCPMAVALIMVVSQGLIAIGMFISLQLLLFAIYGIQLLTERMNCRSSCRKCCRSCRKKSRKQTIKLQPTNVNEQ